MQIALSSPVRASARFQPIRAARPDTLAPARPAPPVPNRQSLAALCAPPSRESFFDLSNQLLSEGRPVRELSWDFAQHPDPAVRVAFRQASQELGRSKMSEMERQERVNGGYEALTFLLANAPEQVADGRVTEIIDRLPQNDLSARFCLRMQKRVPCKAELFGQRLEGLPSKGEGPAYGVRDGVILRGEDPPDLEVCPENLDRLPQSLAAHPYGKLDEVIELMARPELRPRFEAQKEAWLGLADRWEERGIDDRFGWNGVYGLELYAAMAEHFPDWKPETRIAPLLAQDQANEGKGRKWLETLPLMPMAPGRARFGLLENAIKKGHQLDAAQRDELLGWFHPLHDGMIHLPWDWNGCRRESMSCLEAALPQLEKATLPVGGGKRLPVREALREHLLQGSDTDVTLTFEDPQHVLRLIEHPELEKSLTRELPEKYEKWADMPRRARNAVALLAALKSEALEPLMEPLVRQHQGRQEAFVAPYRARVAARHLAAGEVQPLLEMARDRRLRAELIGHEPPTDPSLRAQVAGFLKDRLTPDSTEFHLACALVPTFPDLEESLEQAVLRAPQSLTPELREVFSDRLAQGRHSGERQRREVQKLLGDVALPEWRAGARGWVAELGSRLPSAPDKTLAACTDLLLTEDDPGRVARELLDRIQVEMLLSQEKGEAEVLLARLQELVQLRRQGQGLDEALHAVQPAPGKSAGGVLVREDAVIVGGTQLRVRR